jgi:hypothetical protein
VKRFSTIILSIALLVLVGSCDLINNLLPKKTGFVSISLAKGDGVKTLAPSSDMVVAKFDVTFSRAGSTSIQLKDLPGTTTTTSPVELLAGTWSVEVIAYNAAGDIIGKGNFDVAVVAGKTATSPVTVSILAGNGTLNLSAIWTGIDLVAPTITGTLTPISGTPIAVSFVLGTPPSTATYSSTTIPAGSYTMDLLLKDGTDTVSRVVDTVQILKETTTSGTITFVKDPNYWGQVKVTITVDLPSPITYTFNPVSGTKVREGNDTTITATPSRTIDSYRWYVNGVIQPSATGASFNTGTSLAEWVHKITVIGRSGSVLSSASMNLEIIPKE